MAKRNFWDNDEVVDTAPTLQERKVGTEIVQGGASADKSAAETKTENEIRADKLRKAKAEATYEEKRAEQGPPKSEGQLKIDQEATAKEKRAATVNAMLGEVKSLYARDIEGQPISRLFGATEYINSVPENERFTSAGNAILPLIRPLVAQSAKEGDSDKEMEVFKAYIPAADDADKTIEQKFKMLEMLIGGMVDGKPPSQTLSEGDDNAAPAPQAAQTPPAGPSPGGTPPGTGEAPGGPSPPTLSPGDPGYQPAAGAGRTVADPQAAATVNKLLRQGASLDEVNQFALSKGLMPVNPTEYKEVLAYLRKNPGYKGGLSNVKKYEPNSAFEQLITKYGANPVGAYAAGAGQFLSGNTLDNIAGTFDVSDKDTRLALDILAAKYPTSSAIGEVSGGAMGAMLGEAGLARMGMSSGLLRAGVADAATGAANGAGMADNGGRLTGAGMGAGMATAGGLLGTGAGKVLNSAARGVSDPAVRLMQDEVGPLTVGQTYGGTLKAIEDKATSIPIVGDMIKNRQRETYERFNAKAFERALKPIDGTVNGKVGEEAMADAQTAVSQAFTDALAGAQVQADQQFVKQLTSASTKAANIPRLGPEVADTIKVTLEPYMQGPTLTGEAMQEISRQLRELKAGYRVQEPALYKRVAGAIDEAEEAIFGMFRRQAPEVLPAYNSAKAAHRRVSILADSVNRAKNSKDKLFSPAQLGMSDRANTIKYEGPAAAARGDSPFNDYQAAGQAVLPNSYPDSGTAGRLAQLALPGAIAGTGAGLGYAAGDPQSGAAGGLSLAALLAAAYTKGGQRLLTKPGRGISGSAGSLLGDERLRLLLEKYGAGTGAALLPGTGPGQ